jgi:hypothetical protein
MGIRNRREKVREIGEAADEELEPTGAGTEFGEIPGFDECGGAVLKECDLAGAVGKNGGVGVL